MQTVKNKFKNIKNELLKFIHKDTNFILSLKQPKNLYSKLHLLDSYQILKTLENKELINAVINYAKYVKFI